MTDHTFGNEVNASRPKPTRMAQLILDLRKLGKSTSPSVNGPGQLRDHLDVFVNALVTIHERTLALIDDEAEAAKPKTPPKRKSTKGKDRQETGGTNRSDSD